MTYPWHGWWSQCVLVVPYFTFHWFFSSMNLNDILIFVLADFRARKIFILVWSDIIWSLQFILVSLLCVHISNIYGHIVNTVIAQKLLHLYLITQEHEIISLCKKVSNFLLPSLDILRIIIHISWFVLLQFSTIQRHLCVIIERTIYFRIKNHMHWLSTYIWEIHH